MSGFDYVVYHWVISPRFIWRKSAFLRWRILYIPNALSAAHKETLEYLCSLHLSEQIKPFSIDPRGTISHTSYIHTTARFYYDTQQRLCCSKWAKHTHTQTNTVPRNKASNRKWWCFKLLLVSLSHPATSTIKQWQWHMCAGVILQWPHFSSNVYVPVECLWEIFFGVARKLCERTRKKKPTHKYSSFRSIVTNSNVVLYIYTHIFFAWIQSK